MKKISHIKSSKIIAAALFIVGAVIAPLSFAEPTHAAQITGRDVTLSSSVGGDTGVTYTLSTDALPTSTAVQSLKIQFCVSIDSCGSLSGFSSSSSTLSSQPTGLGAGAGWTVDTTVANELRIANAANVTAPSGAVSVTWDGVDNPTATNTTFYGIITTYSDSAWTTAIDSGSVALSTSESIQVALTIDETLTFCTGTSITGENCGTVSGTTVDLGSGSPSGTSTGTSVFAVSTNANTGYNVTVNGTTLTSGSDTIDALTSNAGSSVGTEQFGINLVSNSTPSVGSAATGSGTGAAETNYDTADSFRFTDGEQVASAAAATNANAFTVSYIANVAGVTEPGSYTTNLNYIATANF